MSLPRTLRNLLAYANRRDHAEHGTTPLAVSVQTRPDGQWLAVLEQPAQHPDERVAYCAAGNTPTAALRALAEQADVLGQVRAWYD